MVEPTTKEIDALLSDLDEIARDYDHYEFGLPMFNAGEDDSPLNKMRSAVLTWLAARGIAVAPYGETNAGVTGIHGNRAFTIEHVGTRFQAALSAIGQGQGFSGCAICPNSIPCETGRCVKAQRNAGVPERLPKRRKEVTRNRKTTMDEPAIPYLPMVGKPLPAVREALNWLAGALEDVSFPWDDDHHRFARDACQRAASELEAVVPSAELAQAIREWNDSLPAGTLGKVHLGTLLGRLQAVVGVDSPDGAQR